jgi:hypothetical protein
MRYAQLVIGPAGSGKVSLSCFRNSGPSGCVLPVVHAGELGVFSTLDLSMLFLLILRCDGLWQSTYCKNVHEHCSSIGRTVHVVNLDPAADNFEYPVSVGTISIRILLLLI